MVGSELKHGIDISTMKYTTMGTLKHKSKVHKILSANSTYKHQKAEPRSRKQ